MLPEPSKQVVNKTLTAQNEVSKKDPRSLCIWKICLKSSTFSRKPSWLTKSLKTYRIA